ncbi:MAG: GDP-L-fucose synthase [Planctomycetales bacterium]
MDRKARIFVAGGDTLVGGAIVRRLRDGDYTAILGEPDLRDPAAVEAFFREHRPEYVFLAGGRSGGIGMNRAHPAELMLDNLRIDYAVIDAARRHGARRLLYVAPPCVYPRDCPQPMRVEHLLSGPLEPTNEAYAVAKLAGIKLCQACRTEFGVDFRVGITANPYGPGEDFSLENSHVIPALLRKMHEARERGAASVEIWGTGRARREFLFADDVADGCLCAMRITGGDAIINLGGGSLVSIADLAERIRAVVGYGGGLRFDASRPDGMPEKTLDGSRLAAAGWSRRTNLDAGLRATYEWYLSQVADTGPLIQLDRRTGAEAGA